MCVQVGTTVEGRESGGSNGGSDKTGEVCDRPPLPYSAPSWGGAPKQPFHLTVIKHGTVVEQYTLNNSVTVFGRLPHCDVALEHPSISRYHAVLQCRPSDGPLVGEPGQTLGSQEAGLYMFDLGSTHGTFLNKHQLAPRCYHLLREGQMFHLGGSSRLFLLEVAAISSPHPSLHSLSPFSPPQETSLVWKLLQRRR